MKKSKWMKQVVRAGRDFHITKQSPLKHNILNLFCAVLIWSFCGCCFWLAPALSFPMAIVVGLFAGTLFFAHFILVIHEASHNMFLIGSTPQQSKKLNRMVGIVASAPFFTEYIRHWEEGHLTHHLQPCEEIDPQNPDPLYGDRLYKELTKLWLIPFYFIKTNPSRKYPKTAKRFFWGLLFWSIVLSPVLSLQTLVIFVLAWNVVNTLNLLKISQEHGGELATEPLPIMRSRTYFYFYPLQMICSPFFINYHFEHHANFNVPWYRLPEYHKAVLNIVPQTLQPYYFHREYIRQMNGQKPVPTKDLLISK